MIVAELHYLLNTFKFMKLFHQIYHKILADTIEYYRFFLFWMIFVQNLFSFLIKKKIIIIRIMRLLNHIYEYA